MSYFSTLLERTEAVVATTVHYLGHPKFGRVDLLVGTGLSGTMALVPLRQATGLPIMMLRKPGTRSHGELIEGSGDAMRLTRKAPHSGAPRYLIVDDFADTGSTLERIVEVMSNFHPHMECAGCILYQGTNPPRTAKFNRPIELLRCEVEDVAWLMERGGQV